MADHLIEVPGEREFVSTRVFNAPREQVFRAFSDPLLLAQWWGPNGFSNTFHEFDFRAGGAWRFVMRGTDGGEYLMTKQFVVIDAPERLVIRHLDPTHGHDLTMTLTEAESGTRLVWRMKFEFADEYEKVKNFIPAANEENFDRLDALVSTLANAD
jgi:uncharacterized protein YndB with AHSA1/START domain